MKLTKLTKLAWISALSAALGMSLAVCGWANYAAPQVISALHRHLKERVVNPVKGKEPTLKIVPAPNEREVSQGRFSHITLESSPVEINKKLTFETLRVYADDVLIDPDKLMKEDDILVKSYKRMSLYARITAHQFTSFLAKGKHTKDMNLKVNFENNKLHVTGNWKLFLFSGPIDTVGRLIVRNRDEIYFNVESLRLNGIGAPRSLINKFEEKVNPVVDSKDLPLAPPIDAIRFNGDTMIITGERGK